MTSKPRRAKLVASALTLHYSKMLSILEPTDISRPLPRKQVDVRKYPDGIFEIRHGDQVLVYWVFDNIRQLNQAAIVENKHLGATLMMAKLMQEMFMPGMTGPPICVAALSIKHGYSRARPFDAYAGT